MRNSTLLPVAWKLSGQEMLGEEFSFNQEQGIVQPKSEFPLTVHFRAVKPNNYKKNIKVEVSVCVFKFFTRIVCTCILHHC